MYAVVNGHRLHYRREGRGPVIAFVHALGCDLSLWDPQVQALANRFETICYDVRGHGQSDSPAGSLTFDDLAADLYGLLQVLGIGRAHLVGCSMGGVIVRLFALRYPDRTASLILCSTMAQLQPGARARLTRQAERVREQGIEAIVESSLAHWFPASAGNAASEAVEKVRRMLRRTSSAGYLAVCNAVSRLKFLERQREIAAPTLVVAGEADPGRTAQAPDALARAIPGADLRVIPGAGHFPNLEAPAAFNALLADFVSREPAPRLGRTPGRPRLLDGC